MIFHNFHTISIRRFKRMTTGKDISLACKIPMPKIFCIEPHAKMVDEFNNLFSKNELNSMIESVIFERKLLEKSQNLLPIIREGVALAIKYDIKEEDKQYFIKEFKDLFGFEPTSLADLKYIDNSIRKTKSKLKELRAIKKKKNEGQEEKEFTIETTLIFVQRTLECGAIDRSMSMYSLYEQYEAAKEIVKLKNAKTQ